MSLDVTVLDQVIYVITYEDDTVFVTTETNEPENNTRVYSVTTTTTLTPNVTSYDAFTITAQASALSIANPTGSPVELNAFIVRITSSGAYAISFGSIYRAIGSALPTTTTANKTLYFPCVYNSLAGKYDVFPSQLEV